MSWSAASLSVVRVIRNKVVIASGVASPPRALAPLSERAAIFAVSRGCPASQVGRARTSSWPFPKNTVATENGLGPDGDAPSKSPVQHCGEV